MTHYTLVIRGVRSFLANAASARGYLSKSQLPRIGKCKGGHSPRILVENQGAGDRRFGALAAIFAFAQAAVDPDRRALGFLKINAAGIDEFGGMADFTPQTDRKARLCLRMRRDLAAHDLRDREIARAVWQFDDLAQQAVGRVEGGMHVPQRTGAAEL